MSNGDQIERIKSMESILNDYEDILIEEKQMVETLNEKIEDYQHLIAYYLSDDYHKDVEDSNLNRIPSSVKQGVLTEDAIYNLMTNHRALAISLIELGTKMLKTL